MKTIKFFSVVVFALLASCASVQVNTDYDKKANFEGYKTFAFLKSGVDKATISDLDKKRILYAIEDAMVAKGFTKSENPEILISFFTKEKEAVAVTQNYGWGYGWGYNPYWGMGFSNVHTSTQGVLFIDIIDAKTKELIWQGEGSGTLTRNIEKKEARIKEFVNQILAQYPPQKK